jgi:predicted nucleic acid-binding protein
MPLYLLDTDVLSRLARGVDRTIADNVGRRLDECVLSAVAWYELEYGAARSSDPAKSRQRLALLVVSVKFSKSRFVVWWVGEIKKI